MESCRHEVRFADLRRAAKRLRRLSDLGSHDSLVDVQDTDEAR